MQAPASYLSGPRFAQCCGAGAPAVDTAPIQDVADRGIAHGSGLGRHRWVVERGFAWLHAFKRLRTRYERRADIHLGLLRLACALICYRQLPVVLK